MWPGTEPATLCSAAQRHRYLAPMAGVERSTLKEHLCLYIQVTINLHGRICQTEDWSHNENSSTRLEFASLSATVRQHGLCHHWSMSTIGAGEQEMNIERGTAVVMSILFHTAVLPWKLCKHHQSEGECWIIGMFVSTTKSLPLQ